MNFYSTINPPCTFCVPGNFGNKVESLLCSSLFNSSAQRQISGIYEQMLQDVNKNIVIKYKSKDYIKLYPLSASYLDSAVVTSNLNNTNENVYAGHDLPVWLNDPEKADVKIMFVSQDPHRSDEEMVANKCNELGISTPWGIHSLFWRKESQRGLPFHVAMNLIEMCENKKLSVYFTDVYKLRKVDPSSIDRVNIQLYRAIIEQEIEIVQPNIIIAIGAEAYNILSRMSNFHYKVLKLPHPNAHPSAWKDVHDCIACCKGNLYINKIESLAKDLGLCK